MLGLAFIFLSSAGRCAAIRIAEESAVAAEVDAGTAADQHDEWFWRKRQQAQGHPFNAPVISRLLAAQGEQDAEAGASPCARPLLAQARMNRTSWQAMKDLSSRYFKVLDVGDSSLLHSTAARWAELDRPVGALPVVPGMRLIEVNGKAADGYTWAQVLGEVPFERDPLEDEPEQDSFLLSFQAGYDFRACWGDTVDEDGNHVCGPEAMAALAEDLLDAQANETSQGSYEVPNVRFFTVETMATDKLDLLRRVAPVLQADADDRMGKQEGMCYRSALTPICTVLQLPGVCRGEDGRCANEDTTNPEPAYWVLQRRLELPSAAPAPITFDGDEIQTMNLHGPQISRSFTNWGKAFGKTQVWHREDHGFTGMFPKGLQLDSCGSREAALALQLDSQVLNATNMTNYPLTARFYQLSGRDCFRHRLGPNQTLWPLELEVHRIDTEQRFRLAVGITNWLDQDVRGLFNVLSKARSPSKYSTNFMRMFPHYFRLEPRFVHANESYIVAKDSEPAELLEDGMAVRALEKIKYKSGWFCTDTYDGFISAIWAITVEDCKDGLVIDGVNHTFYSEQMDQLESGRANRGADHTMYAGDVGKVVRILRREGKEPVLAVSFDKYGDTTDKKGVVTPAPFFAVYANQVVGQYRQVVQALAEPHPEPSDPVGDREAQGGPGLVERVFSESNLKIGGGALFIVFALAYVIGWVRAPRFQRPARDEDQDA